MEAPRRESRQMHILQLDISFEEEDDIGQVIDWTHDGIQVLSVMPLKHDEKYRVRFHIERTRFEKIEGSWQSHTQEWTRGGDVRWVKSYKDGCWFGVQFDESLHDFPLEDVKDFLNADDFCHMAIFLADEDM